MPMHAPNFFLAVLAAVFAAVGGLWAESGRPLHAQEPPPPWQSTEQRDHPLAGRIWRARDGAFVTPAELARALGAAQFILLGETHDNPDHHRIQAWAVAQVVAAGKTPGIAFEMMRADQQAAINAYRQTHPGDSAGLGAALGWAESGWPDWSHYAAVLAPLARTGVPLIAANLAARQPRALARDGFDALGAARVRTLGLDRPLDEAILAAIDRDIVGSHCGMIPEDRARPISRVQVARDATLADGLLAARGKDGSAILIAGSGHVRRDRGVPLHLARRGFKDRVVTLGPLEVRAGSADPAAYGAAYGAAGPPFDFVWFTAAKKRDDPCRNIIKNN